MRRNFLALALSLILALTLCGVAQARDEDPTSVDSWTALGTAATSGGGVTFSTELTADSTITISQSVTIDGNHNSIKRNSGFTAPLIIVDNGGSLNLTNVTFDGQKIDAVAPLIVVKTGGSLTLDTGAKLINNRNMYVGASDNELVAANNGDGGAVLVYGGTLTMKAGSEVSGNHAGRKAGGGGGIAVHGNNNFSASKFVMEGGVIQNNSSSAETNRHGFGGGVFMMGGNFTMSGGSITGNDAFYGAGVVMTAYQSKDGGEDGKSGFVMTGGSITGNGSAKTAEAGGVMVIGSSTDVGVKFTLSGQGVVKDNHAQTGYPDIQVDRKPSSVKIDLPDYEGKLYVAQGTASATGKIGPTRVAASAGTPSKEANLDVTGAVAGLLIEKGPSVIEVGGVAGDLKIETDSKTDPKVETKVTGDVAGKVMVNGSKATLTIGGKVTGDVTSNGTVTIGKAPVQTYAAKGGEPVVSGNVTVNGGKITIYGDITSKQVITSGEGEVEISGDIASDVIIENKSGKPVKVTGAIAGNVTVQGTGETTIEGDVTGDVTNKSTGTTEVTGNITGSVTNESTGTTAVTGDVTGKVTNSGEGQTTVSGSAGSVEVNGGEASCASVDKDVKSTGGSITVTTGGVGGDVTVEGTGDAAITGDVGGNVVNGSENEISVSGDVTGYVTGTVTGTEVDKATYYTVTITQPAGGEIRLDGAKAPASLKVKENKELTFTAVGNAYYYLSGWTVDGSAPTAGVSGNDLTLTVDAAKAITATFYYNPPVVPQPTTYTVQFVDWDGTPIGEAQTIEAGQAAIAPEAPAREGYEFTGWDVDFSAVQSDLTVTAQYKEIAPPSTTFTVKFVDHDGTVLKEEQVEAGKDATPPADPTREGYSFTGWEGSYKNVQADVTIKAQYEKLPEPTKKALKICVEDRPYEVLELGKGKSKTLTAYDKNGKAVEAVWSSDGKAVSVKNKSKGRGKVTGSKTGTVVITATAEDGRYGEIEVEVKKASQVVTSGKLNKKEKELDVGEEYQLKATVKPSGAKNKELYWMSMNEKIATVDQNGKVTAVGPGRVTIKAWTATGLKLWCKFTVK